MLGGPRSAVSFRCQARDKYDNNLGLFESAAELATEALAIRRSELPEEHLDVIVSTGYLGTIRRRQQRLAEAEPLLEQALELARRVGQAHPRTLAVAMTATGVPPITTLSPQPTQPNGNQV